MSKLIIIVGPTAIGKTALGLKTARTFSGDLVNADSRQVYKTLDIISGKDIPQNSQFTSLQLVKSPNYSIGYFDVDNIPLFLVDIVKPSYDFSVNDFVTIVPSVLEYIERQQKLPIIVGGTGFYVNALLNGIETVKIPPNEELRQELERLSVLELQIKLEGLNKQKLDSMNNSDRNNIRRLIRAIEIEQAGIRTKKQKPILENYETLIIGLTAPREIIKKRIDLRVDARIEEGAFEEAEKLFQQFDTLSNQVKSGNGYKQLFEYFNDGVSKEDAIENWRHSEYFNAKKQMTWYRRNKSVEWFDITQSGFEREIQARINQFLASK